MLYLFLLVSEDIFVCHILLLVVTLAERSPKINYFIGHFESYLIVIIKLLPKRIIFLEVFIR